MKGLRPERTRAKLCSLEQIVLTAAGHVSSKIAIFYQYSEEKLYVH